MTTQAMVWAALLFGPANFIGPPLPCPASCIDRVECSDMIAYFDEKATLLEEDLGAAHAAIRRLEDRPPDVAPISPIVWVLVGVAVAGAAGLGFYAGQAL